MLDPFEEIENKASGVGQDPFETIEKSHTQPERTILGTAKDIGITALKSAVSVPESAVGLADIVTGGYAGKALEDIGFRPGEAKEFLDTGYSPAQQYANRQVQQAEGFFDTAGQALSYPSTIAHTVGESIPSMLGGQAIARGAMKLAPRLSAPVAGALGEGVIGGGLAAEQIRQQTDDGLLTPTQLGLAAGTGALTSLIGAGSGKFAKRYGIGDVETVMLPGGITKEAAEKGIARRIAESAGIEGILEELPQSAQEQIAQNLALGKPAMEGVAEAGAIGMLTGGVMGGTVGGLQGPLAKASSKVEPTQPSTLGERDVLQPDTINVQPGNEFLADAQARQETAEQPTQSEEVKAERQAELDSLAETTTDKRLLSVIEREKRLIERGTQRKPLSERYKNVKDVLYKNTPPEIIEAFSERTGTGTIQDVDRTIRADEPGVIQARGEELIPGQEDTLAGSAAGDKVKTDPAIEDDARIRETSAAKEDDRRGRDTSIEFKPDFKDTDNYLYQRINENEYVDEYGNKFEYDEGDLTPLEVSDEAQPEATQKPTEAAEKPKLDERTQIQDEQGKQAEATQTDEATTAQAARVKLPHLDEAQSAEVRNYDEGKFKTNYIKGRFQITPAQAQEIVDAVNNEVDLTPVLPSNIKTIEQQREERTKGRELEVKQATARIPIAVRRGITDNISKKITSNKGFQIDEGLILGTSAKDHSELRSFKKKATKKQLVDLNLFEKVETDRLIKEDRLNESKASKVEPVPTDTTTDTGEDAARVEASETVKTVPDTKKKVSNLRRVTGYENVVDAIKKLGGLNKDISVRAGLSDIKDNRLLNNGKLSKTPDEMAEALREIGFDKALGENDVIRMVSEQLDASQISHYTAKGYERQVERQEQEQYDDEEAKHSLRLEDLLGKAKSISQGDYDETKALAESGSITPDNIQEFEGELDDYIESKAKTDSEKGDRDIRGKGELESYTESELREREAATKQREKEQSRVDKEAKAKEDADKEIANLEDELLGKGATGDLFADQALKVEKQPATKDKKESKEKPLPQDASKFVIDKVVKGEYTDFKEAQKVIEEEFKKEYGGLPSQVFLDRGMFQSDGFTNAIHDGLYELTKKKGGNLPIQIKETDVSRESFRNAYSGISFSPNERGDTRVQQYVQHMVNTYNELLSLAKTDEQKQILNDEFVEYKRRYIEKLNSYMGAKGRTMSTMITGPANFPTRSNEAKQRTEDKRLNELIEFDKKAQTRIKRNIKRSLTGDMTELEIAQQKLKSREDSHVTMKAANKIVRNKKLSDNEKIAELKALGIKQAEEVLKPDFAGRTGFASYSLTNNNAEIKRLTQRVKALQAKETAAESVKTGETKNEFSFEGGTVQLNYEADRVQIIYDEKPDEATRANLKSDGFKWSPKAGAWQRKITNNAIYKTELVTGAKIDTPTEAKFSKSPKTSSSTVKQIKDLLPRRVQKLVQADKLEVVLNPEDVSEGAYSFTNDEGIEGYYDPEIDKLFIIASQVDSDSLNAVLQHELWHRSRATDKKLQAQLDELNNRLQKRFNLAAKGKGSEIERAAYKRVMDAKTKPVDQLEEYQAYLISQYEISPESFTGAIKKWITDLIATIRASLIRSGMLPKNITPADLSALAKYGAKVNRFPKRSIASTKEAVALASKSPKFSKGTPKERATDSVGKINQWINGKSLTQSNDGSLGMPEESRRDKFVKWIQDGFNRVEKLQETIEAKGGTVTDETNVYKAEERSSGITSARLKDLKNNNVIPLVNAMADKEITLNQLDAYVMAAHAEERNNYIASINPEQKDGGSGLLTKDANEILADFDKQGLTAKLEALADRVYEMNQQTLNTLVYDGLIDAETYHQYQDQYSRYVPLKGKEGVDDRSGTGQGYSVGGSGLKAALGRGAGNVSESPVAHTIAQAESAIIRAEKTRVGQTLVRLMKDNPDPDFWTVTQTNYNKFISLDGELFEGFDELPVGLIENQDVIPVLGITAAERKLAKEEGRKPKAQKVYRIDPSYKYRKDVFNVMMEGKVHQVTIKDDVLAEQLKKLQSGELNHVLRGMGSVNRFLAMINTALNPEFVITNLERDLSTAGINLAGEHSAKMAKQVIMDVPAAAKGIWQSLFNKEAAKNNKWSKLFTELEHEGGTIGFFGLEDIETKVKKIESLLKQDESYLGRTKKGLAKLQEVILDANQSVENAARLASYKAGLDAGMTKKQAASLSKNLTVNFNRRGEIAPVLNAAYLFANASIQGTARIFTALKHPGVRKIAGGIASTAFALAAYNMAAGGDDDDGVSHWEKLSDYIKQTNLVIMHPDGSGEYFKIKMPYGYNVFWYTGTALHDLMFGKNTTVSGAAGNMMTTITNAFNPIQGADFLDTITPTILKPLEQDVRNINFMNTPIRPENPFDRYDRPESDKAFLSTNKTLKSFAKFMNEATGGTDTKAGVIDISPESMKHYIGWMTGGAGMTVYRGIGSTGKLFTGETIKAKDVPFIRTLGGSTGTHYDTERFYQTVKDVEATKAQVKTYRENRDPRLSKYITENRRVINLQKQISRHKKRIKKLRTRKNAAFRTGNYEMADKLKLRIAREMRVFIRKYDIASK